MITWTITDAQKQIVIVLIKYYEETAPVQSELGKVYLNELKEQLAVKA